MPELLPPEDQSKGAAKAAPEGPPAYTGTWTLRARKGDLEIEAHDITGFEFVDGVWFIYDEDGATAISISRWDTVSLIKDHNESS